MSSLKWHVIASCLGSKEMWEPRSHDTLVLPQTSWQQPPSPKPYVPIISSNPVFVSCVRSDTRATPQPGPILESTEEPLPRKRRKLSPIPESTEKPPPRKRRKPSHQQHSLREHKVAVMSDQSFMVLYPSRANSMNEIQDQPRAKPSPRIVNAVDVYIDSRVRDLDHHAEWWLKYYSGLGDNDVVLLAMNLLHCFELSRLFFISVS
ncbi:hypothetical protein F5883DRAFT_174486 [Diaporthe sp. PMI_573]|nr:hypothetical protein F5883DRAFT_174486 [Diaporthaceae sp. PMI_573]